MTPEQVLEEVKRRIITEAPHAEPAVVEALLARLRAALRKRIVPESSEAR